MDKRRRQHAATFLARGALTALARERAPRSLRTTHNAAAAHHAYACARCVPSGASGTSSGALPTGLLFSLSTMGGKPGSGGHSAPGRRLTDLSRTPARDHRGPSQLSIKAPFASLDMSLSGGRKEDGRMGDPGAHALPGARRAGRQAPRLQHTSLSALKRGTTLQPCAWKEEACPLLWRLSHLHSLGHTPTNLGRTNHGHGWRH